MSMNAKAAHTVEHAFIGSLQKILNRTLSVRKVEHKDSYNVAFISASEIQLDLEKISKAQKEVNRLILEGRKILHHSFSSLNEAKMKLPNLRANEARLADAEKITVVEIENHDVAACSMEHVNNLSECIFFLVTSLSKNASDYEIKFMVGKNAMDEAVNAIEKINMICDQIDANYNTVEATIRRLYTEREQYYGQLKKITNKMLNEIPIQYFEKNNVTVMEGFKNTGINIFYAKGANITDDTLMLKELNANGGNISTDRKSPQELIDEAVSTAGKADVIVAVLGESQGMSGEAASRSEIGLPESQENLLKALVKTGKPVVLVLMNGRPLTLDWENRNVTAM